MSNRKLKKTVESAIKGAGDRPSDIHECFTLVEQATAALRSAAATCPGKLWDEHTLFVLVGLADTESLSSLAEAEPCLFALHGGIAIAVVDTGRMAKSLGKSHHKIKRHLRRYVEPNMSRILIIVGEASGVVIAPKLRLLAA